MAVVHIGNFAGLGNRLEALLLAVLIAERHGHRIRLDWPEADTLEVAGASYGRMGLLERLRRTKVRDFDEAELAEMGRLPVIDLRGTYGPPVLQRKNVLGLAARLRLHTAMREHVVETLRPLADRPVVGVHIRHGDFLAPEGDYDAATQRHPAAPMWWYEQVLEELSSARPGVCFLMGRTGDVALGARLRQRFDILEIPSPAKYRTLLPGHAAQGHPVADLFGLACCTTLVATPTSSFSHWAANALGPPATVLLPPPRMSRKEGGLLAGTLHGCNLLDWRAAAEEGRALAPVTPAQIAMMATPPRLDWL